MAGTIGLTGCGHKDGEDTLNIFVWTEYIPDAVIEGFEEETGITVNASYFSSNEEMLAKVRTENSGTFDLLQPSGYMIESLIHQGLLEQIDSSGLTGLSNIGSQYLDQSFDPGNLYSVPYMGSVTAIAVNQRLVQDDITSCADLLDEKYANSIVVLDDCREILGCMAYTIGLDGNEEDEDSIERISEQAERLKPNIKLYDSDSPKTALANEDCSLGIVWTAEIALAMQDNPDIGIVFPSEGCSVSTDNWCVPKGAPHFDNAMRFIDYVLRPEVAVLVSEDYPYVQVNQEAIELLPEDVRADPAQNVPSEIFENGHLAKNLMPDALKLYEKAWTSMKG
jgi:spermidine/putrescine-binding protein